MVVRVLMVIQMFTDFITECRAHKLKIRASPGISMGTAKAAPPLDTIQIPQPVAVAA
jgi:hypothetical protein